VARPRFFKTTLRTLFAVAITAKTAGFWRCSRRRGIGGATYLNSCSLRFAHRRPPAFHDEAVAVTVAAGRLCLARAPSPAWRNRTLSIPRGSLYFSAGLKRKKRETCAVSSRAIVNGFPSAGNLLPAGCNATLQRLPLAASTFVVASIL